MSYWRGQETKKVVVQPWLDKKFYNKSRKNPKEFRREKFEQLNCRNKWERMKGKKKKTNPKQILSQFMCTIKSNWHKPNPWGGTFALLTKKKKPKLKLQTAFYPSQIHDSTDYYSQPSTIAMLPVFFFRIITLGGEQRKGCKGGAHNPGSMTFLCRQQQQNQLQTTQRWFAGEQREKTAESFLTSSCSSLPWGYCCPRGEGSWWPLTRGGQGF